MRQRACGGGSVMCAHMRMHAGWAPQVGVTMMSGLAAASVAWPGLVRARSYCAAAPA